MTRDGLLIEIGKCEVNMAILSKKIAEEESAALHERGDLRASYQRIKDRQREIVRAFLVLDGRNG